MHLRVHYFIRIEVIELSLILPSSPSNVSTVNKLVGELLIGFPDEDSSAVSAAIALISNELSEYLMFIKNNFSQVYESITKLESTHIQMLEAIGLIEEVLNKLNNSGLDPIIGQVKQKVNNVLKENPGYSAMANIKNILQGCHNVPSQQSLTHFLFYP